MYKLIAGRPRDYGDAIEVMHTCTLSGAPIDVALVRSWAQEWGVEERLQRLLDDVK